MSSVKNARATLDDIKVHVKIKIAGLWTTVMFCYLYADYFGLFQPGTLKEALQGKMVPLGTVTQGVLVFTSAIVLLPSVMIFLSLALRPDVNRWLNIIMGVLYTVIIIATMPGSWAFYIFFGVVEVILTSLVAWYAWSWPKQQAP